MESSGYFDEQLQSKNTMVRTAKERQMEHAPLVSLADQAQLMDTEGILSDHEKALKKYRDTLKDGLPSEYRPVKDEHFLVGMTSETTDSTESYISVTSGYDIRSMENELLGAWKYQRYFRSDSEDMKRLKRDLHALTEEMGNAFKLRNMPDIRIKCEHMRTFYAKLILSCENYLDNHKNPHSIAGKARKSMADRLIKAAAAEMNMLEDSAINCYEEALIVNRAKLADGVEIKWEDIVHHGRMKVVKTSKTYEAKGVTKGDSVNTYELMDRETGKHDMLTVAHETAQADGCLRIVAMSKVADALGLSTLGGSGENMYTRMTTRIIDGNTVYGCITTGLSEQNDFGYSSENSAYRRPNDTLLPKSETYEGEGYIRDKLAIPFLDYLCGVTERDPKYMECMRKETDSGTELGEIHTTPHHFAKKAFGGSFAEFAPPKGTVISPELTEKIIRLKEEDLIQALVGLLGREERALVVDRLRSLKTWVTKNAVSRDDYDKAVKDELKEPETEEVNFIEKLTPLDKLAKVIGEPQGKNKKEQKALLDGLNDTIEKFNDDLYGQAPVDKGWNAVKAEIDSQYEPIHEMNEKLKRYLENADEEEDYANRVAVERLILASEYQEQVYRKQAESVCNWVAKFKKASSSRQFDFSFNKLYTDASLMAQRNGINIRFPEVKPRNTKERMAKREMDAVTRDEVAISIERDYSEIVGHRSLHDLTEKLDKMLDSRDKNSEEIEDYGKELGIVVAIKDEPIFGPNAAEEYRKAKATSPDALRAFLVTTTVNKFDKYFKAVNDLTDARNAYFEKQDKRIFQGVITGESRMNLMDEAYKTCVWEHDGIQDKTYKKGSRVDVDRLQDYVQRILNSGKSIEKITLTDITNMMLLDEIKISGSFSGLNDEIQSLVGTKRKFIFKVKDSPEYEAVSKGMSALVEARKGSLMTAAEMQQYYTSVLTACNRYIEKNKGSKNERMDAVMKVKDACTKARTGFDV